MTLFFNFRTFKDDDQEVKLISVPKFFSTSSIVMLNLRTMEAEDIQFENNFFMD